MAEQMRKNDRVLRKTQRDVERERGDLERQEKKLVSIRSDIVVVLVAQWTVPLKQTKAVAVPVSCTE